jgi:hypothetical protein
VDDGELGRGEHALALVPEPIAIAQPLELGKKLKVIELMCVRKRDMSAVVEGGGSKSCVPDP